MVTYGYMSTPSGPVRVATNYYGMSTPTGPVYYSYETIEPNGSSSRPLIYGRKQRTGWYRRSLQSWRSAGNEIDLSLKKLGEYEKRALSLPTRYSPSRRQLSPGTSKYLGRTQRAKLNLQTRRFRENQLQAIRQQQNRVRSASVRWLGARPTRRQFGL